MTVYKWSQTAASNDTADSSINWLENQAPSTLNNSARAMMAALAKFYADVEMYANNFDGTDPEPYLAQYLCNKIPGPDNQWQGENSRRDDVSLFGVHIKEPRA